MSAQDVQSSCISLFNKLLNYLCSKNADSLAIDLSASPCAALTCSRGGLVTHLKVHFLQREIQLCTYFYVHKNVPITVGTKDLITHHTLCNVNKTILLAKLMPINICTDHPINLNSAQLAELLIAAEMYTMFMWSTQQSLW